LRVAELCRYQDADYARHYLGFLRTARDLETARPVHGMGVTEAVALSYFKLMAYKDEYEVARLLVDAYDRDRAAQMAGPRPKLKWHLQPAFLRSMGVRNKIALGQWFVPFARALARLKFLRGTRADVFGTARLRRTERALVPLYQATMIRALKHLDQSTYDNVVALAGLPDLVRGYEDIKLKSIEAFESRRMTLLAELQPPAGLPIEPPTLRAAT
jgi:indolepyruvate ferredoxin oxidoreductase